ncbi:MAG: UbiA prenyltransferase family protein [Thermoplasmata archaeon]|nr:UbiA prenyltransferase family protein [Thermoplasmata archaeon]
MGCTELLPLLALFIIGLLVHVFSSVTNEILDKEEDRKRGDLQSHPLASGELDTKKAIRIAFAASFLLVTMTVLVFESEMATVLLLTSVALFGAYNVLNRSLPCTEFIFAGAFICLALFGSLAVGVTDVYVAIFVAVAVGLHALSILTIYIGLWTYQFGTEGERGTIPWLMGARERGGRFFSTALFLAYSSVIQTLFLASVLLPFLLNRLPYEDHRGQVVVLFLSVLAAGMITYRTLASPLYDQKSIRLSSVVHYILVGIAFSMMFIGVTPWAIILAFLPLLEMYAVAQLLGTGILSPSMGSMPPRPVAKVVEASR